MAETEQTNLFLVETIVALRITERPAALVGRLPEESLAPLFIRLGTYSTELRNQATKNYQKEAVLYRDLFTGLAATGRELSIAAAQAYLATLNYSEKMGLLGGEKLLPYARIFRHNINSCLGRSTANNHVDENLAESLNVILSSLTEEEGKVEKVTVQHCPIRGMGGF